MLDSNQIQDIIPHRYPFLLVDRIEELDIGKRAVGIKCVSANEMQFVGHFPKKQVMPGVLIIESIAQVGAVAILSKENNKGKIAYFAGIKNAKFRKQVKPGNVMRLEATLIKQKGSIGFSKGIATVDDEVVCECELIFAIEK